MTLTKGPWFLKDLREGRVGLPSNGRRVFSTFSCGGGSTMGYKLAGYSVIGNCEIDPQIMKVYRKNHEPKFSFEMPLQEFNKMIRSDVPEALKNLDILDGSPPCSVFSMAGSREDKWGKKVHFREGQAEQVLDDLFFHFIETAEILRPKVVVSENVMGMLAGNAKGYVKEIFRRFQDIGYHTRLFKCDASMMGVPQKRERVFFISSPDEKNLEILNMNFGEKKITPSEAFQGIEDVGKSLTPTFIEYWKRCPPGAGLGVIGKYNAHKKLHPNVPAFTQTGSLRHMHWNTPRHLNDLEVTRLQSFPDDYDYMDQDAGYICGMSVPPFMMMRISERVRRAFFL